MPDVIAIGFDHGAQAGVLITTAIGPGLDRAAFTRTLAEQGADRVATKAERRGVFDVADLRLDVIAAQLGGVVLARLGTAGQPRRQAFGHRLRHPGAHDVGGQLGRDLVVRRIRLQRVAVA
ncbi:hypothetical protein D3C73_1075470 [compost metagenome]